MTWHQQQQIARNSNDAPTELHIYLAADQELFSTQVWKFATTHIMSLNHAPCLVVALLQHLRLPLPRHLHQQLQLRFLPPQHQTHIVIIYLFSNYEFLTFTFNLNILFCFSKLLFESYFVRSSDLLRWSNFCFLFSRLLSMKSDALRYAKFFQFI